MNTFTEKLRTNNLHFKLVNKADASFILKLRTDIKLGKFLTKVESNLAKQLSWIEGYQKRSAKGLEYYFVIIDKNGEKVGLVRLYDINENDFSWGSWILKTGVPSSYAIESALLIYEIGFEFLKLQSSIFEVLKDNEAVISFHLKTKAEILRRDKEKVFFKFERSAYLNLKSRYKKFKTPCKV